MPWALQCKSMLFITSTATSGPDWNWTCRFICVRAGKTMSDTYKYDPIITANGSHSPALSRFCTLVPAAFSLLVSASTSHAGEPGSRPARSRRVGPISSSSSSSSPLLSLVTSTSEISHQPVHSYTTYIWQWGRQNRKTGNVRKIQHLHEEREEEKKCNP